jgi:hypothetical protein
MKTIIKSTILTAVIATAAMAPIQSKANCVTDCLTDAVMLGAACPECTVACIADPPGCAIAIAACAAYNCIFG